MTHILIVHSSARPAGESVTRQLAAGLATALAQALPSVLIEELLHADIVVIGAPMYNFGIPSTLKAWIDHVAKAGRTFRYDRSGNVEGLVSARRAYVVTSRGGDYGDGHVTSGNFVDPYLRVVLRFLGMNDVEVIAANGQALDPAAREQGIAVARRQSGELAAMA